MYLAVPVPWWTLALLIMAAVLVAYHAYARPVVPLLNWQRAVLTGLRLLALLLVLLFLLEPVRTEPAPRHDTVVPILIDQSRSMRIADLEGEPRIGRAVALVRDQLVPQLAEDFEVDVLTFGDELRPANLATVAADATRTNLAGALEAVGERYQGRSVAGVVVISDGGETGNSDAARIASERSMRVYAIGIGAARPGPDREVISVTAGEATAAESIVDVSVSVVSHGFADRPIELRLLEAGRLLQVRRIAPAGDGSPMREVFRVSPRLGMATLYTVDIPVEADELVTENNTRSVLVRPATRTRRILLIEGAPGYEHSFLKRAWLADRGITLDAVVRKGQNDRGEYTFYVQGDYERAAALATGYPLTRKALFRYDAVVFANIEAEFFRPDQLTQTAEFVADRGGGLLMLGPATLRGRGWSGSGLEYVMPVELVDRSRPVDYVKPGGESNKLVLTADGVSHPMMQLAPTAEETRAKWTQVPALGGSVSVGDIKPGASVLAVTQAESSPGPRPLVVVQRYGSGRAMVFAGLAAWRWRMMLPADDRTYETFWGQVASWLTASAPDPVTVTASGAAVPGETVRLDVRVRDAVYQPLIDAEPVVVVTGPGGDEQEVRPALVDGATGLYTAEIRPAEPGVYRFEAVVERGGTRVGEASEWLLVGGADVELADPWLNDEVLRRTATASGGRYLLPDDVSQLRELVLADASDQVPPVIHNLWRNVWMFLLVVVLLSGEWFLRHAWGMK